MDSAPKTRKVILVMAVIIVGLFIYVGGKQLAATYYFGKGKASFDSGNFQEAKTYLTRSLTYNGKNPKPYAYLGRIALGPARPGEAVLYPEANYEEAIREYEKAIALGIEKKDKVLYSNVLNDSGFSYWMLRDYPKAHERFMKQIAVDPDHAYLGRYILAWDYSRRLNKPKEALDILLPVASAPPRDSFYQAQLPRFYSLLAYIYYYFRDFSNVKQYANLAIENAGINSGDSAVLLAYYYLAFAYGTERDFAQAEIAIKNANNLGGSLDAGNCYLARAYFLGENYPKAIELAKAAGQPVNVGAGAMCLSTLGKSFLAMGNKTEAKKYFQEYLKLTDTFSEKSITIIRNRELLNKELEKL